MWSDITAQASLQHYWNTTLSNSLFTISITIMYLSFPALVLATILLNTTLAQPLHRVHKRLHRLDLAAVLKEKRQDWFDPSNYKGVDFTKVQYGNASPAAPPPVPAPAPAPAPGPASAPAPAPVVNSAPAPSPAQAAATTKQLSAAPVTNSNTGSGKRGLVYDDTSPSLSMFNGYSKITWGYNWGSKPTTPNGGLPSNFQFVPMLKSNAEKMTSTWADDVSAATRGSGTHYLMAFNEPDMLPKYGGTAMDVGSAVATYKDYMDKYASGNVKLGAPAVSSSDKSGQGLDGWLKPFLQQCSGCTIDFVPVHWYGSDPKDFISYMQKAMSYAQGRPVWVTEFQCKGGDEQAFLAAALPWLDGQAGIARYSYFMASGKSLTNGNSLSAVGQKYAAA